MRPKIFICYCHADSAYQLRLSQHLKPLQREGYLTYWSDRNIKASEHWKEEIKRELSDATISILLISADFLASDFITAIELPVLLKHTRIFPVMLNACFYKVHDWLSEIQFVNPPERPLSKMQKGRKEEVWASLVESLYTCIRQETPTEELPDWIIDCNGASCLIECMEPPRPAVRQASAICPVHGDFSTIQMFIEHLLRNPRLVRDFWTYAYEHIDILDFMLPAEDILLTFPGGERLLEEVKQLFLRAGWEGDGKIRLLWFPPFLKIEMEDTWGTLTFFVKQENNGTSFIACPAPLRCMDKGLFLKADAFGYYTTEIEEERYISDGQHRCLRIAGLLASEQSPYPDESHWLFFFSNRYQELRVGDRVRFKPKEPLLPLRDFPDLKHTRNIYISDLQIL